MSANCPHCQTEITSLSGFIKQEDHENRLKSKNEEKKALEDALKTARTKANGYDAIVLERNELKGKLESQQRRETRTKLLTDAKVNLDLLPEIEKVYGWSQDGVAESDRKSFEDWFANDAAKSVLLAPHFGANPGGAGGDPGNNGAGDHGNNGGGPNTLPLPNGGRGDPPKPKAGKMTEADLAAIFDSPQFQALDSDGKRARIAELKAEVGIA